MLNIFRAETDFHFQQVRELTNEFMEWDSDQTKQLGLNAVEVVSFYYGTRDDLPGHYAPPEGCLLLASDSENAAGTVAFRRIATNICEINHMYVRPQFRGKKLAHHLIQTLIANARESGYDTIRLETTTFMQSAIALYSSFGFRTRTPYREIPKEFADITIFMELNLST